LIGIFRFTEGFTEVIINERLIKLVSIINRHALRDRNGFNLHATKESLHIVTIIVIISFIVVLCVLIILTLTAALAKIGAG